MRAHEALVRQKEGSKIGVRDEAIELTAGIVRNRARESATPDPSVHIAASERDQLLDLRLELRDRAEAQARRDKRCRFPVAIVPLRR